MKKIYPLLPYLSVVLGIISLLAAGILVIYSFLFKKMNEDIAVWLACFGLFCIGYRKEKNEKEYDRFLQYRYQSFRISFVITIITALTCSSYFIFSGFAIKINCLYAVLFLCFTYNVLYFIFKIKNRNKNNPN
jgi:hypothetical protein